MDLLKEKITQRINDTTLIQNIQCISGLLVVFSLLLDLIITGKFINQYIYLFIFATIAIISARLTDRLIYNLGKIKLSTLKNEIQHLGLRIQTWDSIPRPSFLEVEYEERAVIEAWVCEIRDRYILNWYDPHESSKFVVEAEEELRFVFKGILNNLQSRNWEHFLVKLTNLLIVHLKRKSSKISEPIYRHPILMKTLSEHDYYVSAISALLNKFGRRTKYSKYADSMFCSLHHLVIIEILAHQLVCALPNVSSISKRKKNEIILVSKKVEEPKAQEVSETDVQPHEPSADSQSSLEQTHIKIIEGSPKNRPSISLPNILNKSTNIEFDIARNSAASTSESAESNQTTSTRASSEFGEEVSDPSFEDEGDDLESAISKLRQLFEEKESDFVVQSKENNSLKIPSDGRIFFNVQLSKEGGDVYVITYDAVIINKTSSIVPSSNQFEYTTKTMQATRTFEEFLQLERELKKKFNNLEFTLENNSSPEQRNICSMDSLNKWLDTLIHHYEASTSVEVKHFLKYPTDDIDLQLGKADKGQRIDKFLAKTVSGVFNSIKDRLPNFEEADNSGIVHEEEVEKIELSSEESGIYTDIRDRLEGHHHHSDKEEVAQQLHLPVKLNFSPMANELSELEINLNCAIHEELRLKKDQMKQNNLNEGIVFQRGENYKKFIEKEMFKDELSESLTDKLIHLAVLAYVDEMKGKYDWLKSKFVTKLAKLMLSASAKEVLTDILTSWTNENAWMAIFMHLRQALWYEDLNISSSPSSWLENQAPILQNIFKNAFSSREANRELLYNVTDLILNTVLKDDG